MIEQAHIVDWRHHAPWATDAYIEQDLVLSRALVEIFSTPNIVDSMVFRGGTALNKLFFPEPLRYSEDIDLVVVRKGPIGEILDDLRGQLDHWLGEPKRKRKQNLVTLLYRFQSELPPIAPLRLKIEINTEENFNYLGTQKRPFLVDSPWFRGETNIPVYSLEETIATKLKALYQRKKGRDLFDLEMAIKYFPELDVKAVLKCFKQYLNAMGLRVSRAEFEQNLFYKVKDKTFANDISPLLNVRLRDTFDPIIAYKNILEKFVCHLPGKPWKGEKSGKN